MNIRKKILLLLITILTAFSIINRTIFVSAQTEYLYLGGIPAGFTIKSNGAVVIGLSDVVTENGVFSPAKNADIKIGDILTKIDKQEIFGSESIAKILKESKGNPLEISVVRNGENFTTFLTPKKDKYGNYKLGVFLRDDLSGIGTITYFTKDGKFAALGHPILNENKSMMDIKSGKAYLCSIVGIQKGEKGKAGELQGIFIDDRKIGQILKNTQTGIYGKIEKSFDYLNLPQMEIANAKMGKARIFTCIDGEKVQEYTISIVKIDNNNRENKNFVIKIDDKNLLSVTGGILQGMSGSPIVQDGKIIGAITHVFINDPTRGFGISIDKMLQN